MPYRKDGGLGREPLFGFVGSEAGETGADGRGNTSKAHVYDIVNAGPRNVFTVSDCLVFNCVHGTNFGMGWKKMYMMNEDKFESPTQAKRVQDIMRTTFKRVFAWQDEIRKEAHLRGVLVSRHGCLRRFTDVYRWDQGRGGWAPGSQSEEAIAYLPANESHCHLKEVVLRLDAMGALERYNLVNYVHDSLVFDVARELTEECITVVMAEIEKPSTVLIDEVAGVFQVGCEAALGPSWGEITRWKGSL